MNVGRYIGDLITILKWLHVNYKANFHVYLLLNPQQLRFTLLFRIQISCGDALCWPTLVPP